MWFMITMNKKKEGSAMPEKTKYNLEDILAQPTQTKLRNFRINLRENRLSPSDIFFILARARFDNAEIKSNNLLNDNNSIENLFKRIDSEYVDFVKEARELFSESELDLIILNYSQIEEYGGPSRKTNLYIPYSLKLLALNLLDIKNGDTILQPYSGDGDFAIDFLKKYPEINLKGVELARENYLTSQIKASLVTDNIKSVNFVQGDFLDIDLKDQDYNKVFSMPPINNRPKSLRDSADEALIDFYQKNEFGAFSDWAHILKIILDSKFERAVFIVSSKILFNERDAEIRKYLIQGGFLEGVIELPSKLFYSTGITTNMIVLSKNNSNVRMIDASKLYQPKRHVNTINQENLKKIIESYQNETDNSALVTKNEFEENKYSFLPKRYTNKELELKDYVYLKDVANIKRGHANLKKEDLDERLSDHQTNMKLMTASDITDEFSFKKLDSLEFIDKKEEVYCLDNLDIAFSRGSSYKSLLIRKEADIQLMANGTLYIISCNPEKINPFYLQLYLSSDHCAKQLTVLNAGSVIKFISISQLEELKIPKVTREFENELAAKYESILDQYEILNHKKQKLKLKTDDILNEVLSG